MITVAVSEREPNKIQKYITRILNDNDIRDIQITQSGNLADITVLCDLHFANRDLSSPITIVNCDIDFSKSHNSEMKLPSVIIDCGISFKSSVTASSIFENGINYCIQREFKTIDGREITPQEFKVKCISDNEKGVFKILACITVLLLSGISIEKIKGFNF